jgi:hypothetical protein
MGWRESRKPESYVNARSMQQRQIGMQSAYDFWVAEGERCACSRI